MFSFGRDARYRLEGHHHNPYIGSFHTVDRRTKPSSSSMLLDSSLKNPFIGTVRHSPAGPSVGLKGILWEEEPWKAPVTSQVKLSREKRYSNRHASITLLASIPVTRFKHTDAALPLCGICLDTFKDGDELRPLPCSHCFHRACVDEWLLGLKSDERTFTNNCPCCRQDISPGCSSQHLNLSTFTCPIVDEDVISCTSNSSPTEGCAIPRQSFERLGRYLSASDIGTSKTLSERFLDEEDSEYMSDLENDENIEVSTFLRERNGADDRTFPNEEYDEDQKKKSEFNLFSIRNKNVCDRKVSTDSKDNSCFYDISLSDEDNEDHLSAILTITEDRGDNGDIQLSSMESKNLTDEQLLVYRNVVDDESYESEQDRMSGDITLDSDRSNVSICTVTNRVDNVSNEKKVNRKKFIVDSEEDFVSDMEEEFSAELFFNLPSEFPSDDLLGSLYSDCGVPLKSAPSTPRKL